MRGRGWLRPGDSLRESERDGGRRVAAQWVFMWLASSVPRGSRLASLAHAGGQTFVQSALDENEVRLTLFGLVSLTGHSI